jgi:phage tail sheath protein FI
MPLFGGFDGTSILQKEPIVNQGLLDNQSELNGAAYRAVKTAIDMISDPEFIEYDLAVIPNLKTSTLTADLVEVCKTRGDALAIIDMDGDYKFAFENGGTADQPVKDTAITSVTEMKLDNSYGATYFPAVYVPAESIFMPASIAALGSYAGTEARSAVWFAPAGFNRGGLTVASSGIGVSRTALPLNASARDDLYAANINPIATFPGEGVVIFGQKTLQFTPSALDRVNVRRLMNFLKKQISRAAVRVLFEPNVKATWDGFKAVVEPFLLQVKNAYGLDDAKIVLDETTTTADLVDRNIMYCKLYVKPTRAIEYVAMDFIVTNSGAAFAE